MPTDPRVLHPRQPGETKVAYAARLNALGVTCACGCGVAITFYAHALDRSLYRRRHDPALQSALARRAAADPDVRARKRAASLALWTEAKREAWSAMLRAYWQAGRYVGIGPRTRERWRSGTFGPMRRWTGGIRAELLKRFPDHAAWIHSLADADLEGLFTEHQVENMERQEVPLRLLTEARH